MFKCFKLRKLISSFLWAINSLLLEEDFNLILPKHTHNNHKTNTHTKIKKKKKKQ